eukprot:scaffold921_cov397-Prasinococcus_capsulatus_cf.AAC.20
MALRRSACCVSYVTTHDGHWLLMRHVQVYCRFPVPGLCGRKEEGLHADGSAPHFHHNPDHLLLSHRASTCWDRGHAPPQPGED